MRLRPEQRLRLRLRLRLKLRSMTTKWMPDGWEGEPQIHVFH
jgi:hypothetical protein